MQHSYKATYFKPGSHNVWCQRCGKKLKVEAIKREWDGLMVCSPCFEERHPQDMVRGVLDHQAAPLPVPEIADKYVLPATVTGLTTAALASGPEELFDDASVLTVHLVSGALPSASELDVLNGANTIAVQNSAGAWEILQYTVASLIAPNTYSLTHLLRARYGTELAMGAPSGSPFVYLGDAGPVNVLFMRTYLDVGDRLFSPINISAYENNGDVVFQWMRRSRTPSIELDDWSDANFPAPLDSADERYDVEVMNGGVVTRTLHVLNTPQATYAQALHLEDWASLQSSLTVRVYQVDHITGRGTPRTATLAISYGTAFNTLYDDLGGVLRDQNGSILTG